MKHDRNVTVHHFWRKENHTESSDCSSVPEAFPLIARGKRILSLRNVLTDWMFLAVLGINVACLSIFVDLMVHYLQELQEKTGQLYSSPSQPFWMWMVGLVTWCCYTVGLVAASASFVHFVSPQAIGSGIPEMKTIIRGVILKDYLTLRTLVSKVFGITMSIGSGIPIGKMGPFVHISSVVANQLCSLAAKLDPTFREEGRRLECLAAACAVGVASVFSAPVGVTVSAFFQTSFPPDAFSVKELPLFASLGLICGLLGALYINLYRSTVLFMRNNRYAKPIFQRHWIVYPIVVSSFFCLISYPSGLGNFTTGRMRFGLNLRDFFSNCTYTAEPGDILSCGQWIHSHWLNRSNVSLILLQFILIYIASLYTPEDLMVHPGIYAVVGAASFSASVTHTVSVSVIIFELTGQLHFLLPVMISVVLSNAVCAYLQPSLFDTIIKIKHLPFLPDIPPSSHMVHTTFAENIMVSPVMFLTKLTTYKEIQDVVNSGYHSFPVTDSQSTLIGDEARKKEAGRRVKSAIETLDWHIKTSQKESSRRSHSDMNLESLQAKKEENEQHMILPEPTTEVKNSRFLVVPAPEVTTPPATIRRNSLSRRNAFCSLQQTEDIQNKENDGGLNSMKPEDSITYRTFHAVSSEYQALMKSYMKLAKKYLYHMQFGHGKKMHEEDSQYDLFAEEKEKWQDERLLQSFEFTDLEIDPAPFQLVKKTSLYKIHSIFSMLQLNKAYVTDCGRLIGVVSLSDVSLGESTKG
ncbi:unnamed protein product [Caenorhabditis auriculariae]|uniref:Chloride channel protein n=1 Tax=Caenorhabditis auriculariae TaxID=2777116 RepID=A0A8S1GW60_9PELO|nr:unnamed protein product [Caenorhabditis auriculariae]